MSRILIGPAGWSYEDWHGRVYPPHPRRGFSRLGWVARFFDLVEVNVSFYRVPSARMAQGWIRQVQARDAFRFTVKLHQSLTHRDRRVDDEVVASFREFLAPLREAGRLGPLLAQFPWSFRPEPSHLDHLRRLVEAFAPDTVAIEVRHGDWGRPEAQQALAELPAVVVSVDQPRIGNSLAPLLPPARTVGYVRLHGRNARAWFDREAGRDARYDYDYAPPELREWADRIGDIARSSGEVHVVTNNHFRGQAVANAFELKALLGTPPPEVPRALWEADPQLRECLRPAPPTLVDPEEGPAAAGQGRLF